MSDEETGVVAERLQEALGVGYGRWFQQALSHARGDATGLLSVPSSIGRGSYVGDGSSAM